MVTRKNSAAGRSRKGKLRYAVVGLGHIAQVAVLPAFANAEKNSQLTALVSGNPRKLKQLSKRYQVPHTYSYEEYDECLSSGTGETQRFDEVPEMVSAVLRFPNDCLASFTTSFGAADVSTYRVVGTQGDLVVDQAYEYVEEITHTLTVKGKKREQTFARRDQFAAELIYFSKCVLTGRNPEPGGKEGLADVRIIQALRRSAENGGKPVKLNRLEHKHRPSLKQEIRRSPVQKPDLIDVSSPSA